MKTVDGYYDMQRARAFSGTLEQLVKIIREKGRIEQPAHFLSNLQNYLGESAKIHYQTISAPNTGNGNRKATKVIVKNKFSGAAANTLISFQISLGPHPQYETSWVQNAGGIVFSYPALQVLCVGSPVLCAQYNKRQTQRSLKHYKITRARDGTAINLYWHNNEWKMGTANSTDISRECWIGDKSYREMLDEVLSLYPAFDWAALDKNICYTIGFRHHAVHLFEADPQSAWLIQATRLNSLNHNKPKIEVCFPAIGLPMLAEVGKTEVENFLRGSIDGLKTFVDKSEINYGYVLRHNRTTGSQFGPDIILGTNLFQYIKSTIYNSSRKEGVDATNRKEFICLLAAQKNDSQFKIFFPQLVALQTTGERIMTAIVAKVFKRLYLGIASDAEEYVGENAAVTEICSQIQQNCTINLVQESGFEVVDDLVRDANCVPVFARLLSMLADETKKREEETPVQFVQEIRDEIKEQK